MRTHILLLFSLLTIVSPLAQAQQFLSQPWQVPSHKPARASAELPTYLTSPEVVGKFLLAAKLKRAEINALTTPEWLYSEGQTEVFENGQSRYYVERLSYSSPEEYTVTVDIVNAQGQILSTVGTGSATVDENDTLIYLLRTRQFNTFKDAYYYKGVYDDELDDYKPVLVKTFEYQDGLTTTTEIRHFYSPSAETVYEMKNISEGVVAGEHIFNGFWLKEHANGNSITYRTSLEGTWVESEKYVVTQTGNRQEETFYISLGEGQWQPESQYITLFNADNNVLEQTYLYMQEGVLAEQSKTVHTYQGQDILKKEHFQKSTDNPAWHLVTIEDFAYNTAGQMQDRVVNDLDSENPGAFVPSIRHSYLYYAADHPSAGKVSDVIQYEYEQGNWLPSVKNSYSYATDGIHYSYSTLYYKAGQWEMSNEFAQEVDERNLLISEARIIYLNGTVLESSIKTLTYIRSSTVLANPEELAGGSFLSVYPNPVHETVTLQIQLQKTSGVSIHLFSQAGQKVKFMKTGALAMGVQRIPLPVQDLQPGVYVCQVQIADGVQTLRFIKN